MSIQHPYKVLEINVMSAHDLPPVSKMLRTFAVAYVHPDNKLTTRIDHQGHTNPSWNYKVSFPVDDKFLKNESSALTIDIYNLAWLRDLPIGTAHLLIHNISPPLLKNPSFRRLSVRVCRPSGHFQGTLNLGIQLLHNNMNNNLPLPVSQINPNNLPVQINDDDDDHYQEEKENVKSPGGPAAKVPTLSRMASRREYEFETKTNGTSGAGSFYSVMRPLPSEVAADLKRGVYTREWSDYGSSIFDNWTELGDKSDDQAVKQENAEWPVVEDQLPMSTMSPSTDTKSPPPGGQVWKRVERVVPVPVPEKDKKKKKKTKKKKGLFSFFGNAYGFQFSFFCGSKGLKKKKKKRDVSKKNIHLMSLPETNLINRYYD